MTQESTPQPGTDGGGLRELIETRPGTAKLLGAGIIIILTLLAYIPAMNGLFIWDDNHYVVDNTLLRSWEGLGRIWTDILPRPSEYPLPQYYPLTHTSFWLEYQLWGRGENDIPRPMPYHVTNVVLHICNALLIWLLLTKLDVPGAWLAAAIFALHPIQAESVSWISERKNVLSMFFFLSSLYVYLRYAGVIQPPSGIGGKEPTWRLPDDPNRVYALAIVLFLCALWSKTITNSMPAVALVLIWWKRGLKLQDFRDALPLLLMGAAMGALTGYMEHVRVGVAERPQYWDYAPTAAGEIGARLIVAGRVVWFYVQKLLVPIPLIFNYPRWTIDPGDVVMYLVPLSVIAVLAGLVLLSRRIGKGPAAAALIFVGTLFPAMGFVNVWPMQYSFVADHFVYLSSISLIALITAVLWKKLSLEGFAGVAVCVLLVFAGMTWGHCTVMSEMKLLWEDTLRKTSNKSWFAMNNYAVLIRDSTLIEDPYTRLDEAEKRFLKVIELKPDHPEARLNLAVIEERRGILADYTPPSTQPTTRAAATQPTTRALEHFARAVEYYREAIRLQPNYVPAHFGLASLLRFLGHDEEALFHFHKCVEYYPRHSDALRVLAEHSTAMGNPQEAMRYLSTLVELHPDSPRVQADYGWALLQSGQIGAGFAAWELALGVAPEDPRYANEFGVRMAAAGDFRRAFEYFRIANNIDGSSVDVITNLGIVAARMGQPAVAKTFLTEALKRDANFETAKRALENLEAGRLGPPSTQSTTQSSTQPSTRPTTAEAISQYLQDYARYASRYAWFPGPRPGDEEPSLDPQVFGKSSFEASRAGD